MEQFGHPSDNGEPNAVALQQFDDRLKRALDLF